MSIAATNDLETAVRKLRNVQGLVEPSASKHILEQLADAIVLVETHNCPIPPPTFVVGDEVAVVNDLEHLPVGTVFTDSAKTRREAMLTAGGRSDGVPRELVWSDGLGVRISSRVPPAVFPLTIKYLPGVK